jgi:hypothetical protein
MFRTPALLCAALTFTGIANAQVWQEEFTGGSNEGGWEIWWNNYNTIEASGGSPGEYLRLDNSLGGLTCHFLEIFPTSWPASFSGDWRAAGIDRIGLDVNLAAGATTGMGEWTIKIANDAGTPGDDADDCFIEFVSSQLPPQSSGWQSFEFAVPTSETSIPFGWSVGGPCAGTTSAIWNSVITDVSYFRIKMDTDPLAFCNFFTWDFGVDNLRVEGSSPTAFCFGDGTATACPCGNGGGAGEGCANSSGAGGIMASGGTTSVAADNLTFAASQLLPGQPALLFVGVNAVNAGQGTVFGDGLRCAGGSVVRLGVQVPDASGNANWGPGLGASGGWSAGDSRHFQGWYRDPVGSPCGAAFNLTHGLSATMTP